MRTRFMSLLLALSMLVFLVGCTSDKNAPQDAETDSGKAAALPGQIEMIVPYSAGGGTDNAARIIADALSKKLGSKVIITNKPGASSEIGNQAIAEAPADGSVIGVLGVPDPEYLVATKETAFTMDDFYCLASYNLSMPMLIGKANRFNTLEEVFEYGKEHPGEITIGVGGGGPKVEAAILMSCGDFTATIVDFPGSADVSTALLSGDIDLACLTPSYLSTLEPEGCVPLVYFSELKMEPYTDVPTLMEKGFDVNVTHNPVGVIPASAPDEVVEVFQNALDEIGADPEIQEAFEAMNTSFTYMSGDELQTYMDDMNTLIGQIVEKYNDVFQ